MRAAGFYGVSDCSKQERLIVQHLLPVQNTPLLRGLSYRGLRLNVVFFFLMQILCILFLCQQLAYVFPLTHRFPLKRAIMCWSSCLEYHHL